MFTQDDKYWYKEKLYQYGSEPRWFYESLIKNYTDRGEDEKSKYLQEIIDEYDKTLSRQFDMYSISKAD